MHSLRPHPFTPHVLQRAGALAMTVAVAITTLITLPGTAHAAAPIDPRPAREGAAWLAGELTDGLIYNEQFDFNDYGLTVDTGIALDAVERQPGAVSAIGDAMAANVRSYITGRDFGSPDDHYAGPTAKSLVLAHTVGADPTDFGGVNVVRRMQSLTISGGPSDGRIKDRSASDFANTIGQAFAARGLHVSGSAESESATDFLLEQQCAAGYFRLAFAAPNFPDQSCDGGSPEASSPDVDVTALAVLSLVSQQGDAEVDEATARAVAWLRDEQRPNGSFGGGTSTEAPNTNSTGLAGWALGTLGREEAAARAATWVRARQTHDPRGCGTALRDETGAVAYDSAALAAGRRDGIDETNEDQYRRASAQALPSLLWAEPASGMLQLDGPRGFVREGSQQTLRLAGVAPGDSVCVTGPDTRAARTADAEGTAAVEVRMPEGTASRRFGAVDSGDRSDSTLLRVLGDTRLAVDVERESVPRGGSQQVRVAGLEPGESVELRYRGDVVDRGTAGDAGRFTGSFRVGRTPGQFTVRAGGEFPEIRFGSDSFRVR